MERQTDQPEFTTDSKKPLSADDLSLELDADDATLPGIDPSHDRPNSAQWPDEAA